MRRGSCCLADGARKGGSDEASSLLQNMSPRPRTLVQWQVSRWRGAAGLRPGAGPDLPVRFQLDALPRALDPFFPLLEEAWSGYALAGAMLVYTWREPAPVPEEGAAPTEDGPGGGSLVATDPLLVLNVLGRSRGGLLLARAPLFLDEERLARIVASDDPRLVRLARRTGVREETP